MIIQCLPTDDSGRHGAAVDAYFDRQGSAIDGVVIDPEQFEDLQSCLAQLPDVVLARQLRAGCDGITGHTHVHVSDRHDLVCPAFFHYLVHVDQESVENSDEVHACGTRREFLEIDDLQKHDGHILVLERDWSQPSEQLGRLLAVFGVDALSWCLRYMGIGNTLANPTDVI